MAQKKHPYLWLAQAGVIAAMYTALTMILPAASFGPIQVRLSEALTILPVFSPVAVPGLTVGCLLANMLGLATGANPIGAWDLLLGPTATLLAALLTRLWRNKKVAGLPILSCLPPIFFNAVIIGAELSFAYYDFSLPTLGFCMGTVGLGQLIACLGGGLILYLALDRSGAAAVLFRHTEP